MSTLESIKGIGPRLKEKLNRNHIYDCFDMMNKYPSRYEIFQLTTLSETPDGIRSTLEAKITSVPTVAYIRKKFTKLSFKVIIDNYPFTVSIFNREYLRNIIDVGEDIVLTGTIDRIKNNFTATTLKLKRNFKNEMEPIYNLDGVSDTQFQKLTLKAIEEYGYLFDDELPSDLIKKYRLITHNELLRIVHHPYSMKDLEKIERRIKYEELFKFQFKMQYIKLKNKSKKNYRKTYDIQEIRQFIASLPFELTEDQKKVTNEIVRDIKSPYVMNRLLQGDTGSGKTVVSAISVLAVMNAGFQVAMMAPTEILAAQHYKTFSKYFKNLSYPIIYLTGKLSNQERKNRLAQIKSTQKCMIIGTHALFSDDVIYNNLGYVITDEQHRFGVKQRQKLQDKGFNPDVLYMSATPIPRTLAISLFGDMDISTIRQKPASRKPVETKLFKHTELNLIHIIMDEELRKGHQIFVVTPLILESEKMDLSNAQKVFSDMTKHFKDYRVGILHSKIHQDDKDQIMQDFTDNNIQIMVSTTVIEVGVDVPNATLMVVFNSERFGLSQLHQLRGRIGRSDLSSYCLLIYQSDEVKERLEIMEKTDDGFILSEEDLRLRGPGDFFGFRQSGDMKFLKADIVKDQKILEIARQDALEILQEKENYSKKEYHLIFKYLKTTLKKAKLA